MFSVQKCGPISAVPTNELFLGENRRCTKFQNDISRTQGLVHAYVDGQMYRLQSLQLSLLGVNIPCSACKIYPFNDIKTLYNILNNVLSDTYTRNKENNNSNNQAQRSIANFKCCMQVLNCKICASSHNCQYVNLLDPHSFK